MSATNEGGSAVQLQNRKILHVDMDAFYASVEQRDNPHLRGRPVAVGGQPDSRGVVAASSYEARQYGVRSAMASSQAARLCPELVFLPPRFEVYRQISLQIHRVFQCHATLIEPLSLDEAYLDVSESTAFAGSATRIAEALKQEIFAQTGLVASAGVSYNKFLAKVASDVDKPNGLFVIPPRDGERFVAALPVERFYGIGAVTAAKLHAAGISNGADLREKTELQLQQLLGNSARFYYQLARGIDNRPVSVNRVRKSIGAETTFETNLTDLKQINLILNKLSEEVGASLKDRELLASTVTIKARYPDFETVTRSYSPGRLIDEAGDIAALSVALLERTDAVARSVRLLGVTASGLIARNEELYRQLELPF